MQRTLWPRVWCTDDQTACCLKKVHSKRNDSYGYAHFSEVLLPPPRHTQKSDDESLSFDSLASHVEALLSGPGYLAEIATKAFNSLTTNTEAPHGGRDQSILEGGNIWKDILALNARWRPYKYGKYV